MLGRIAEAACLPSYFYYRVHLQRRTLSDRSKEKVFGGKASMWVPCDLQADVTGKWFAAFDWEGGHTLPLVF